MKETRGTGWYYFPGPIAFLGLIGTLGILLEATMPTYSLAPTTSSAVGVDVLLVIFLVGLIWLLFRYVRWISIVFAVTNRRVILQRGILSRDMNEIPVEQVRGVDVHQSIWQRLLGYGTIRVSSEGGQTLGNEDWEGVPRPFQFQQCIENATIGHDTKPKAVYMVPPPGTTNPARP